jgi:hypothetical protein
MSWVKPKTLRKLRERVGLSVQDVEKEAGKLARAHYAALRAARVAQTLLFMSATPSFALRPLIIPVQGGWSIAGIELSLR